MSKLDQIEARVQRFKNTGLERDTTWLIARVRKLEAALYSALEGRTTLYPTIGDDPTILEALKED